MKKWWATYKMTQNQQLVVPSFPISSDCKKDGMKMCYDCAPKTISPPSFWVDGFFSLGNFKRKLTPDTSAQILELWGTHVHIVWGQRMCICPCTGHAHILWHVYHWPCVLTVYANLVLQDFIFWTYLHIFLAQL